MKRCETITTIVVAAGALLWTPPADAQTFGLDDNPSAPIGWALPPVGPIPGYGAENPFGLAALNYPPGFAPSPVLPGVPFCWDSTLLAPGPTMQIQSPLGWYDDSFTSNNVMGNFIRPIKLRFSVDRVSQGVAGSAVAAEFAVNQHPADVFSTTDRFVNPDAYKSTAGPAGYGGVLPAVITYPGPRNNQLIDDATLGLMCGGIPCPSGPGLAPAIGYGTHDNIDQFDQQPILPGGTGSSLGWSYLTFYPDEAMMANATVPPPSPLVAPADIYDVATGWVQTMFGFPFAQPPSMGLDGYGFATDSIDALIMFDNNFIGSSGWGGIGAEANIDYALFSLAPGSQSLWQHQLDASDVFYTNFSGTFWLYAPSASLGLRTVPGGHPNHAPDSVDALEILYHCQWDLNGSGTVEVVDLLALLSKWGPCHGCQHDFSDNGTVDVVDLLALLGAWGACPP